MCIFWNQDEVINIFRFQIKAIDRKKNEENIFILRHHHQQHHRKFMIRFRKTLHTECCDEVHLFPELSVHLWIFHRVFDKKCRALSKKSRILWVEIPMVHLAPISLISSRSKVCNVCTVYPLTFRLISCIIQMHNNVRMQQCTPITIQNKTKKMNKTRN